MGGEGSRGFVLVADDEPLLRSLTQRILTRAGYDVRLASDGDEALGCLDDVPSGAAMVLDLIMPSDGATIFTRVRALRPDLRIVLTSGLPPSVELGKELEACGGVFLAKPFSADALVAAVEQTLRAA